MPTKHDIAVGLDQQLHRGGGPRADRGVPLLPKVVSRVPSELKRAIGVVVAPHAGVVPATRMSKPDACGWMATALTLGIWLLTSANVVPSGVPVSS